jgi:hypothetical protein
VRKIGRVKKSDVFVQVFDLSDAEEKGQYMAVLNWLVQNDIDTPIISKGNIRVIQFKGRMPPKFEDLDLKAYSIGHLPQNTYYELFDSFI